MAVWFTSDWHAYDDRHDCLGRGFKNSRDMLNTIIANFIGKVESDDLVYHLGDMCGPQSTDVHFMQGLPGRHYLIRGNYDTASDEYYRKYFVDVYDSYKLVTDCGIKLHLTHEPCKGLVTHFNIVGHIHSTWKVQRNMINVGVDVWHFSPVSLEQILKTRKLLTTIYDHNVFAGELPVNKETI